MDRESISRPTRLVQLQGEGAPVEFMIGGPFENDIVMG